MSCAGDADVAIDAADAVALALQHIAVTASGSNGVEGARRTAQRIGPAQFAFLRQGPADGLQGIGHGNSRFPSSLDSSVLTGLAEGSVKYGRESGVWSGTIQPGIDEAAVRGRFVDHSRGRLCHIFSKLPAGPIH